MGEQKLLLGFVREQQLRFCSSADFYTRSSATSFLRYLCALLFKILLCALLFLDVESELHYIAIFDDVVFALDAQFPAFTSPSE